MSDIAEAVENIRAYVTGWANPGRQDGHTYRTEAYDKAIQGLDALSALSSSGQGAEERDYFDRIKAIAEEQFDARATTIEAAEDSAVKAEDADEVICLIRERQAMANGFSCWLMAKHILDEPPAPASEKGEGKEPIKIGEITNEQAAEYMAHRDDSVYASGDPCPVCGTPLGRVALNDSNWHIVCPYCPADYGEANGPDGKAHAKLAPAQPAQSEEEIGECIGQAIVVIADLAGDVTEDIEDARTRASATIRGLDALRSRLAKGNND